MKHKRRVGILRLVKALWAWMRLKREIRRLVLKDYIKYGKDVPSYVKETLIKARLNALYGLFCCYFTVERK